MATFRSMRWVLVLAPALIFVTGCENNEARVDTKGTTTAPGAAATSEEALTAPATKSNPYASESAKYPGADRKK